MADTKIILEREYNIPLRREFSKVARYKKAKKAIKAVKEFLEKHMKSSDVKLGIAINLVIWKNGITNPPHHIKVNAKKDENGIVHATYAGDDFKILNKIRNMNNKVKKVIKKATKKISKKKTEEKASVSEKKDIKAKEKVKSADNKKTEEKKVSKEITKESVKKNE